jgi:1-deoxy-D-xylulose-5-phosphate reductoisomerase
LDVEKGITIFGSTGSIGQQTLAVVRRFPHLFKVVGLAAKSSVDLLEAQAREFNPEIIAVFEEKAAMELRKRLPGMVVVSGAAGLSEVASHPNSQFSVMGMVGAIGILPAVEAIRAGKDIGLANKEILVAAGELISNLAKEKGVTIFPIDSEHSAIFQCLRGEKKEEVKRIILTASGGPFLYYTDDQLNTISPKDARIHPNWTTGEKVGIDCSTLMNKGFEVIEAKWLFDFSHEMIDVIVHPQSIVQSFVEFVDGSLKALLAKPNMELPIQYALTYPDRKPSAIAAFDFIANPMLEFIPPPKEKFRCLGLAYEALEKGGSLPCFMNAANEVLVERFCSGELSWRGISENLEKLMSRHMIVKDLSVDAILTVDREARLEAKTI